MVGRAYKADVLLLVAACIWGAAFVAQRAGMRHVEPMTFNGVRFALGTVVLLPMVVRRRRGAERRLLAGWRAVAGGGLAGLILCVAVSFQQFGLVYTTAGKAGFITGLYVVIVPFLGVFVGQRAGRGAWIGAALAAGGLYLLSVVGRFTLAPGDSLVLAGAVFWAVHILVLGWLSPGMEPILLAAVQFATCSLLSMAIALVTETIEIAGLLAAGIPILYGGIMSVGVAYTLQVVAQRHAPSAHAAIILSLEAVFAALAGWLILGEVLSPRGLVGCALMLAGMFVSRRLRTS